MRTLKNIFQTTFIIVLFVVTTLSGKAQDIAMNQNNWTNEVAPSVLGINYDDISHHINIYQKDKIHYLKMKGNLQGVFEATIFDVEGKILQTFEVNKTKKQQKFEIATDNLDKGTYIIEIKQAHRKAYQRLFKEETKTVF